MAASNTKSFSFIVDIEVHKNYVKSTKAMLKAAVLDLHNQVGGIKVKIKANKVSCCKKEAPKKTTAPKKTVAKGAKK